MEMMHPIIEMMLNARATSPVCNNTTVIQQSDTTAAEDTGKTRYIWNERQRKELHKKTA